MALQTFTAGQVLTAAQVTALQTNDFNQSVSTKTADHTLVAADKGTRVEMNAAGATTITVNTSLFNAGDTLFIQNIGAGVCTITAGTATVSTSGDLALIQNAGGTLFFVSAGVAIFYASGVAAAPSGLTLISTIALSSASTTVTNCFSSTFENYLIVFDVTNASGGVADVSIQMRAAGVTKTTGYANSQIFNTNSAGPTRAFGTASVFFPAFVGNEASGANITIYAPQLNKRTVFTSSTAAWDSGGSKHGVSFGLQTDATAYDSFVISSGTALTGNLSIYGYQK